MVPTRDKWNRRSVRPQGRWWAIRLFGFTFWLHPLLVVESRPVLMHPYAFMRVHDPIRGTKGKYLQNSVAKSLGAIDVPRLLEFLMRVRPAC